VPPTIALRADIALGLVGLLLCGATVWAVVLCVRKVWHRARSIAAWTFGLSAAVQLLAWLVIPIAVVRHVVDAAPDGEVSSKARILAENISEGMNCTAPLMLAVPATIAVWTIAVWQGRKARRAMAGAPKAPADH
jgi:hypothetical protein